MCSVDPNKMPSDERLALGVSLARQLGRAMLRSDRLRSQTLRQRIVGYLLELFDTALGGVDADGSAVVRITHQLLGEGIGANRESVSKIIHDLHDEGLLRTAYRRVVLLDLSALERISHDAEGWRTALPHRGRPVADAPQIVKPVDSGRRTLTESG